MSDSRPFVNWGQNVRSRPRSFHQPTTPEEIAELVRETVDRKGHIRVVGAGHSWSPVAASNDVLLNLDRFDSVGRVDAVSQQVEVDAGVRLNDLITELRSQGYALANVGSVAEQSIAGATSTGTHGTGIGLGNLATQIAALELIDGRGELHRLERGDDDFDAAALALGALGVLTKLTLDVVPHYNIEERTFSIPFDEALERVPELLASEERMKMWWLPYTGVVQVFCYTTTEEPAHPRNPVFDRLDTFINDNVFDGLLRTGNRFPKLVSTINRAIGSSYFKDGRHVGRWDKMLTLAMPPVHLENEYGVPVSATVDVMSDVRDFVLRDRLAVSFINEVRFVRQDSLWLSGSYGRDSCQFGAYTTANRDVTTFMKGVEAIVSPFGARPHWGKDFTMRREYLAKVYPKWEDFREARRRYDPDDVFANAFVIETFGPHND